MGFSLEVERGPQRIKTFLWLAVHNGFLTNGQRFHRKLTANVSCILCSDSADCWDCSAAKPSRFGGLRRSIWGLGMKQVELAWRYVISSQSQHSFEPWRRLGGLLARLPMSSYIQKNWLIGRLLMTVGKNLTKMGRAREMLVLGAWSETLMAG